MLTKMPGGRPPKEALLRDLADLGRITRPQFRDELAYWKSIEALGGFAQLLLADLMIENALRNVDRCRMAVQIPPESFSVESAMALRTILPVAIAGLGMSRLLRVEFDDIVRSNNFGARNGDPAFDLDFDAEPPATRVYWPRAAAQQVLEGYASGPAITWYENADVAVKVNERCLPPLSFRQSFQVVSGGEEFQASEYLSLQPQLKAGFIP
jgi:hypothetical protein